MHVCIHIYTQYIFVINAAGVPRPSVPVSILSEGVEAMWFMPNALNVKVMNFKQARVNDGSNSSSASSSNVLVSIFSTHSWGGLSVSVIVALIVAAAVTFVIGVARRASWPVGALRRSLTLLPVYSECRLPRPFVTRRAVLRAARPPFMSMIVVISNITVIITMACIVMVLLLSLSWWWLLLLAPPRSWTRSTRSPSRLAGHAGQLADRFWPGGRQGYAQSPC